jgi:hypothetical protein
MSFNGPANPTNCIMARDLKRNLVAIVEFAGNPTNLDLDLNLQPGLILSGFVKDSKGAPLSNALVELSFQSGSFMTRLGLQPVKVDAEGSFAIPALPRGRGYTSSFNGISAPGYGSASFWLKAVDTQTNHLDLPPFVLKKAGLKLAGHVVDADGKPLAGLQVRFSGPGQLQRSPFAIQTDSQGHFAFDEVCEGPIRISVSADGPPSVLEVQGGDTNVVLRVGAPPPEVRAR